MKDLPDSSYLVALHNSETGEIETVMCRIYSDLHDLCTGLGGKFRIVNVTSLNTIANMDYRTFTNTFEGETGVAI